MALTTTISSESSMPR